MNQSFSRGANFSKMKNSILLLFIFSFSFWSSVVKCQKTTISLDNLVFKIEEDKFLKVEDRFDGPVLVIESFTGKEEVSSILIQDEEEPNTFYCTILGRELINKGNSKPEIVSLKLEESFVLSLDNPETGENLGSYLPYYKFNDSYLDLFMLIDLEDFPMYKKSLIEKGIFNDNEICYSFQCLLQNINSVKYLALVDDDFGATYDITIAPSDANKIAQALNLEKILISGIEFSKLPKSWGKLKKIEQLVILNCALEQFNVDLENWPNLTDLVLDQNWLEEINIGGPKLKSLSISENELAEVFFNSSLRQLSSINLSFNQLSTFDFDPNCLDNLRQLNISGNRFISFTTEYFPKLRVFDISQNPGDNLSLKSKDQLNELGVKVISSKALSGSVSLSKLKVNQYSLELITSTFENLEEITIVNVTEDDDIIFTKSKFPKLQSITLGTSKVGIDDVVLKALDIKYLNFFDFDFDAINTLRKNTPTVSISFINEGLQSKLAPLSRDEYRLRKDLEQRGLVPDYIDFMFYFNRRNYLMAYYSGNELKERRYLLPKDLLLDYCVKQAKILEYFNPEFIKRLNEDNIFSNEVLEWHEIIFSMKDGLPQDLSVKYNKEIERSRSTCYSAYSVVLGNLVERSEYLLNQADYNNYKSLRSKSTGTDFMQIGEYFLNESSMNSKLGALEATRQFTDSYDYSTETTSSLILGGVSMAVGGISKIVANSKERKYIANKKRADEVIESINKLSEKLLEFQ